MCFGKEHPSNGLGFSIPYARYVIGGVAGNPPSGPGNFKLHSYIAPRQLLNRVSGNLVIRPDFGLNWCNVSISGILIFI
jgi:hypothetical protein